MDQEIHTEIPLKFVGTSKAVKDDSGTLTAMHMLKVKCLPKDLVHEVEVSIESLVDFHTNIFVRDIVAPKGITILNHADEVVATVMRPREEKVEAPVVAAEGAAATPAEGAAATPAEGAAKDKK
jgi:large subunit ribosomal protein L25